MLNRTSRYVIRVLGMLATEPQRRRRVEELAAATGIPRNYLSKLLNRLRKLGVVESVRGWGGGFVLRTGALELTIGEVLEQLEGEPLVDRECAFGLPECDPDNPCPLHQRWERARNELEALLAETRVGDLARG
ncbi:MAG: Rrf2 family transcriptional regulator [Acidobacteriota bacterium]|nr:MAG: Rrf2 family transcriptional regulator [Acidobacteriota bacterium]